MPDFPEIDPETLAQAIKTGIINRQNVSALDNVGGSDSFAVVQGIADGLTLAVNPSFANQKTNDDQLFQLAAQDPQVVVPTLLFKISGALIVGDWVYQISDDTVARVDASALASGPAIGVVTELPSQGFARIQNTGGYAYDAQGSQSFLPMTPDSLYYVSATVAGELELSPNPPQGGFLQEVGYAKTAYQLVVQIQEPIQV